jgi:hypothetical protein
VESARARASENSVGFRGALEPPGSDVDGPGAGPNRAYAKPSGNVSERDPSALPEICSIALTTTRHGRAQFDDLEGSPSAFAEQAAQQVFRLDLR